jgi:hypothetical protein
MMQARPTRQTGSGEPRLSYERAIRGKGKQGRTVTGIVQNPKGYSLI